jgi:lactoylglutathione lyase
MRYILVAAVLVTLGLPVRASPIPTAPLLSLDHVGIQATDLDRSVAFYTQVLGLREVPAPFPHEAARWVALGNGRMLHIVAHGTLGSSRNRWDHFALTCSNLNAMIARLDALHVAWTDMEGGHTVQMRPDHVRQIFVHDPDGYNIELNDAGELR